jgi:hypothetical protein
VKLFNFSRFSASLVKESNDDPVSGGPRKQEITTMAEHILQVTQSIMKDIEDLKNLKHEISRVNYRDEDKDYLVKFCDDGLELIRKETQTGREKDDQ